MFDVLDAAKVRVKVIEKNPKKAFQLKKRNIHLPDEI